MAAVQSQDNMQFDRFHTQNLLYIVKKKKKKNSFCIIDRGELVHKLMNCIPFYFFFAYKFDESQRENNTILQLKYMNILSTLKCQFQKFPICLSNLIYCIPATNHTHLLCQERSVYSTISVSFLTSDHMPFLVWK